MMWARVAGLGCAVVIGAQGCERLESCTDAYCESGVSIVLASAEPLPTGLYRVTALLDGVATTCHRTLPDSHDPEMQCNSFDVSFFFGDGAAPIPPGGTTSNLQIEISGAPRRIEIEVAHEVLGGTGERIVASESFTPQYETHAPNGEECGPVCSNASIEAAPLMFE